MAEDVTILVVDDDPHMLRAHVRLLGKAGYRVLEAANGRDGLCLARESEPDLILLDVVLPDISGVEVCRRIKADEALVRSFVVLLSGLKTASDAQAEGLEAGADGYIVRPISNRELLARVEAFLRIKRTEDTLREQELLATVGQLAGGVAHEFNNLLTSIILDVDLLLRKPDLSADLEEGLQSIAGESRKAAHLVQQLLDFSRRAMLRAHPTDLASVVREAIRDMWPALPDPIHVLVEQEPGEYMLNVDAARIRQALVNLVTNAREAMPEGGELRIMVSCVEVGKGQEPPLAEMTSGKWACLAVSDTGSGISSETLPHIFEPFFTTKPMGEGRGLGLSQVYGVVKQHKGHIDVETAPGQGTTVRIYLPVYEPAVAD